MSANRIELIARKAVKYEVSCLMLGQFASEEKVFQS